MTDCMFCRMVAGEIPADVVHQTDRVFAFRDINPQAPTHVLVIPKEHHRNVAALAAAEPALLGEVVSAAHAVDGRHAAYVVRGSDPAADVLEPGERRRVGRVVQRGDALPGVVVAHLPHEEGEPAGTVVAERVDHLGHVQRGVSDGDEAHGVTHGPESRGGRWAEWVPLRA